MFKFIPPITLSFLNLIALGALLADKISIVPFFTILILSLIIFFIFRELRIRISYKFRSQISDTEEKTNLLNENIQRESEILKELPLKYNKISFLFDISNRLIELTDSEEIADFIIASCNDLLPKAENIMLFIFQKSKDSLMLVNSLKKGTSTIIKEKKGGALDRWVVRHNQCLLVQDLTKDFRFDYNRVVAFKERDITSFIASPISIGDKMMGTLRIESKQTDSFSLDDSRIVRSICDLGAVALERGNLFKRTEELAIKDPLTSLYLREYFLERLDEEIKRACSKGTSVGIAMLDIDDFKRINDTHGHIVGDIVLKRLAKLLNSVVGGAGNMICRFGGEEFIIFMVESNKEKLSQTVEKIRSQVEKIVVSFRRKQISFTISAGAVLCPEDGQSSMGLIEKADQLLYRAKKEGKNRCYLSG